MHLDEPSRGQGDCWLNFGAPVVVELPPACSQAHAAGSKNRKSASPMIKSAKELTS